MATAVDPGEDAVRHQTAAVDNGAASTTKPRSPPITKQPNDQRISDAFQGMITSCNK